MSGEQPETGQHDRAPEEHGPETRTDESQGINISLEVRGDFVTSFEHKLLARPGPIQTSALDGEGVIRDVKSAPDRQTRPQRVEKEVRQGRCSGFQRSPESSQVVGWKIVRQWVITTPATLGKPGSNEFQMRLALVRSESAGLSVSPPLGRGRPASNRLAAPHTERSGVYYRSGHN